MAFNNVAWVVAAGLVAAPVFGQVAAFEPLGVYSGGAVTTANSHATGVSPDGAVVGFAQGVDPATHIGVTVALYRPAGAAWQLVPGTGYSAANAVSTDGSTIAGIGPIQLPEGSFGPFVRHLPGGATFPPITSGRFMGLSGSGQIAVGAAGGEAIRWTQTGGVQILGHIPGWGGATALALGVSADGAVVVGWDGAGAASQAFQWTAGNGMRGLGFLSAGTQFSQARAVSASGSAIVGLSTNTAGAYQAFLYMAPGGMRPLPPLTGSPGGAGNGVSTDGSVIVGEATMGTTTIAYYWDRTRGRRDLRAHLIALGATGLAGWTLRTATAVSPDGSLIVGDGRDPQGRDQAWLARIPAYCYANCDVSTGSPVLNVADLVCFLSRFAAGDSYANCDGASTAPALSVNDFVCFQQKFAAGCP